jgi:hypothetical protein
MTRRYIIIACVHWYSHKLQYFIRLYYFHVLGVCNYRQGMDWISNLFTQLGTTSNYSTTADLHTLQTANTKSSTACTVFLGSESLGTRDHILLSQIWNFPFRRLRWRYSTPPPEQNRAAGNQPARSLLASIPAGTHGHIIVQCQDLFFSPSFVVPPLIKREGLDFLIISVPLLHLIPLEVTLK